jgi:hypothetical protein
VCGDSNTANFSPLVCSLTEEAGKNAQTGVFCGKPKAFSIDLRAATKFNNGGGGGWTKGKIFNYIVSMSLYKMLSTFRMVNLSQSPAVSVVQPEPHKFFRRCKDPYSLTDFKDTEASYRSKFWMENSINLTHQTK